MDKFKNRYRIASTRAPFWDYGWNAAYFVTICTLNRTCWFGNVVDGKMDLSPMGHVANSCWYEIPNHFPFVELGAHIIMPNHVHGIVVINKPDDGGNDGRNDGRDGGRDVETQNFASLPSSQPPPQPSDPPISSDPPVSPEPSKRWESSEMDEPKNHFGPQSKNLASIIRGFKIGVTKNARQIHPDFAWQPRFHDHIIRNDKSFQRISEYIVNNPSNWQEDKLFSS